MLQWCGFLEGFIMVGILKSYEVPSECLVTRNGVVSIQTESTRSHAATDHSMRLAECGLVWDGSGYDTPDGIRNFNQSKG